MPDPNQAARAAASAWDQTASESTQKLLKLQAEEQKKLNEQVLKYGAAVAKAVSGTAVAAWAQVTTRIQGLAQAGIASSAMGEMLNMTMDRLARGVAGLLGPEIQGLTERINNLSNKMAALDPAQKETLASWVKMSIAGLSLSRMFGGWIGLLGGVVAGFGQTNEMGNKFSEIGKKMFEIMERLTPVLEQIADIIISALSVALDLINKLLESGALRWIAGAAAAILFASIAVKVVAAIGTIVAALKALAMAKIAALAASGPTGWLQLAAGAAIGAGAIYAAVKTFNAFGDAAEGSRKKHAGLREEAAKRVGGLEAVEATWARISAVTMLSGRGGLGGPPGMAPGSITEGIGGLLEKPGKEHAEEFRRIAQATERTASAVEQLRPAIGK